ncbi:MAG: ERF family protein [Planctomycetota bacterium]
MINTSPTILHISAALLKFQGVVDGVGKTSNNPHFKSRYANLETVIDTARPMLQTVGIVFLQSGGVIVDSVMAMTTRLIHAESGEWIEGTMDIALGKRDPQGVGSAQTYAQRYHLMAMLGLPPVDDDGEAAIDRNDARPAVEPPKQLVKDSRAADKDIRAEVDACATVADLEMLWRSKPFQADFNKLHTTYRDGVIELFTERKAWLATNPAKEFA